MTQKEVFKKLTSGQNTFIPPEYLKNVKDDFYIKGGTLKLTPEQISRNKKSYSDLPFGSSSHKLKL